MAEWESCCEHGVETLSVDAAAEPTASVRGTSLVAIGATS
jgi:hypothetical protein